MSEPLNPVEMITKSFTDKAELKQLEKDAAEYRRTFERDVNAKLAEIDRKRYESAVEAEAKRRQGES